MQFVEAVGGSCRETRPFLPIVVRQRRIVGSVIGNDEVRFIVEDLACEAVQLLQRIPGRNASIHKQILIL